MTNYSYNPKYDISDITALKNMFPPTHDLALEKVQTTIGGHLNAFIKRCPFLCISTQNADGSADISPRGDPAGFVKILDEKTLAIPDRPGNNRLDMLSNILTNPNVGLLFFIPGFDEVMRLCGKGSISTDPELLSAMAIKDRLPTLAIIVRVEENFIHCAKALRRADFWNPANLQDRSSMPSLMKIVLDEIGTAPDDELQQQTLDDELEEAYRTTMY